MFSFSNWYKQKTINLLSQIRDGGLTIIDEANAIRFFGSHTMPLQVTVKILHPRFYRRLLQGADIGAAESYIDGDWETEDLTKALQLIAENMFILDDIIKRFSFITAPFHRLIHQLRKNKPTTARKNIAAHYDLGNRFYEAFLDQDMLYSSALFNTTTNLSLEDAQRAKMRRLCDELVLSEQDHLLEIGSGWGALAEFAATEYRCRVTTTTLSSEQYHYTLERIAKAGLQDRVTVCFEDYRALKGQFDKLISIEMIEAVGQEYLPIFFKQCHELLKSNGKIAIQAIIISDKRFDSYSRSVDFIQRYIFPGGFLPSLEVIQQQIAQQTDLKITNTFEMGLDYAQTLYLWRQKFLAKWGELTTYGFDERFRRLWLFYLCYCEAGFLTQTINTLQITATKP